MTQTMDSKPVMDEMNGMDGWLNVHKPEGMLSTKVVALVRRATGQRKVGHAGTLDSFASGVLAVALGQATRTVPYMMDHLKTYRFTIVWGRTTVTLDPTGSEVGTSLEIPRAADIDNVISEFIGDIEQIPPLYSAIKVNGMRASTRAHRQEDVVLQARRVHIYSLQRLSHDVTPSRTSTTFVMTCGKGTYVRSLARDLAARLGTLGYVSHLTRERLGPFLLDQSVSVDALTTLANNTASPLLPDNPSSLSHALHQRLWLSKNLQPTSVALQHLPTLDFPSHCWQRLSHGIRLPLSEALNAGTLPSHLHTSPHPHNCVVITIASKLAALATLQDEFVAPYRVFTHAIMPPHLPQ